MQQIDLLVSGGAVLCLDGAARSFADGAIAIKGTSIRWVGPTREARLRFRAKSVIDASGTIVMPGLIDAHFHTAQQFLRGKIAALGRRRRLKNPIWKNYYIPFEAML